MHYVFDEQEALKVMNQEMEESQLVKGQHPNNAQHKRDMEAYHTWKKKDSIARGILISSMNDDLLYEYE